MTAKECSRCSRTIYHDGMCSECRIAVADAERVQAGPTPRNPGKRAVVRGPVWSGEMPRMSKRCYADRLKEGFQMLGAGE